MKIQEFTYPITNEKKYNISIEQSDDINPTELAMSYQEQYKNQAIISYSRVVQVEGGFIICNLNLKEKNNNENKNRRLNTN